MNDNIANQAVISCAYPAGAGVRYRFRMQLQTSATRGRLARTVKPAAMELHAIMVMP